jgi:hypothetical protein
MVAQGSQAAFMSDIELVIKRCKRLETLLEEELGASGRGLHEKVSSVQEQLPQPLIKRLRFIATVRNKLVHEPDSDRLDNRSDYERACDVAEKELKKLSGHQDSTSHSWATSSGVMVLIIGLLVLLLVLGAGGFFLLAMGSCRFIEFPLSAGTARSTACSGLRWTDRLEAYPTHSQTSHRPPRPCLPSHRRRESIRGTSA